MKTFKVGGIHPPENKFSSQKKIIKAKLPDTSIVMLSQHIGVPATPVVKKGDEVKVGTLIGKGEAFISANIHSPFSGKVIKIDNAIDIKGYKKTAVHIKVEGDVWEEQIDKSPDFIDELQITDYKRIIERIKEAGIVGLGGACFPTHVKYMFPQGKEADTLVINGVECEPYLTSDHRLMLEKPDEILKGIEIMKIAASIKKAVIGIENNKKDAIKLLKEKAKKYKNIEIEALKVQYPQGAEKQLIKATLNREVPSGKLPLDVGVVVNNIGTAFAVYEAVQKNKPLFERVVTLTGKNLDFTANFLVRIGTPIDFLIKSMEVTIPQDTGKFINGGPMMGQAMVTINTPATKGTSGIIIVNEKESKRDKEKNCIRCARCVTACPMGLEPYLLEKLGQNKNFEQCEAERVVDCIECGCCSYSCPSRRALLDHIRYSKAKVMGIMRERRQKK